MYERFKTQRVAVVIPARDEAATVATVVKTFTYLAWTSGCTDVQCFVIDDHSVDDTASRATRAGAEVLPLVESWGLASALGLGAAVAVRSGASIIVHVDADGQYLASDLPAMFERFDRGADLVVGNRLWGRPSGMTRSRYFTNRLASLTVARTAGTTIADTQSGYRVFSAQVATAFPIRGNFTYTQKQVIRAAHAGFVISETPIAFMPRLSGRSRLVSSTLGYSLSVMPDLIATFRELQDARSRVVRDLYRKCDDIHG